MRLRDKTKTLEHVPRKHPYYWGMNKIKLRSMHVCLYIFKVVLCTLKQWNHHSVIKDIDFAPFPVQCANMAVYTISYVKTGRNKLLATWIDHDKLAGQCALVKFDINEPPILHVKPSCPFEFRGKDGVDLLTTVLVISSMRRLPHAGNRESRYIKPLGNYVQRKARNAAIVKIWFHRIEMKYLKNNTLWIE